MGNLSVMMGSDGSGPGFGSLLFLVVVVMVVAAATAPVMVMVFATATAATVVMMVFRVRAGGSVATGVRVVGGAVVPAPGGAAAEGQQHEDSESCDDEAMRGAHAVTPE
jgi:hypothetical protein